MDSDNKPFGTLNLKPTLDEQSVHNIRKVTKQLRARLQLLRQLEGPRQETEQLRQAVKELARLLAAQRDADVMSGLLQELITETEDLEVQQLLAALRCELHGGDMPAGDVSRIHRLVREIEKNSPRLLQARHSDAEISRVLDTRLAALCAAGRELLSGTDWEALHDWRKQVKKLMYQYQLKPMLSPKEYFVLESLDRLGSVLGSINDLCLLERYILNHQSGETRAHSLEVYARTRDMVDGRRNRELANCHDVFGAISNLQ